MLAQIYSLWTQFLTLFPGSIHWLVSLVIFIFLIKVIVGLIKKSFVWLLLLILFVPASIPLIREIFTSLIEFLQLVLPSVF